MRFILIDEQRRNNAIKYLRELDITKPIEVKFAVYKDKRSHEQNSLMWIYITHLASHCGYTPNQMHEELKVKFLGVDEKVVAGQLIREIRSTTRLNTKEFTDYLREIEALALDYGVILPSPDDYR